MPLLCSFISGCFTRCGFYKHVYLAPTHLCYSSTTNFSPQDFARELQQTRVDPDACDSDNNALVHSIMLRKLRDKQKLELLEVLFTHSSADVNLQGQDGNTALHLACEVSQHS